MEEEFYTFRNGDKMPISQSRFYQKDHCGKCCICDRYTEAHCWGCGKWNCGTRNCWNIHCDDENW